MLFPTSEWERASSYLDGVTAMRHTVRSGFRTGVLGLGLLAGFETGVRAQDARVTRTPVLVELFTSEGCSSCPAADRLLGELDREQPVARAEIIALGEHVDYWDELGWHDRFSSPLFTARQQAYAERFGIAGPYTPQMVVDGRTEFVGSDGRRAVDVIRAAAARPKLSLTIGAVAVDGRRVSGDVMVGPARVGSLYAALVDPKDVTEVRRGENGGRRLMHAGVVRTLVRLEPKPEPRGATSGGRVPFSLIAPADAAPAAMRVVVFAIDGRGAVEGAAIRESGGDGMALAKQQP